MAKDHLNQEQRNLQSTKQGSTDHVTHIKKDKIKYQSIKKNMPHGKLFEYVVNQDILDDTFPLSNSPNKKTNCVMYAIQDNKEGLGYIDLTGRFLHQSSRWEIYIMVLYHCNSNGTLIQPFKIRQPGTIVDS